MTLFLILLQEESNGFRKITFDLKAASEFFDEQKKDEPCGSSFFCYYFWNGGGGNRTRIQRLSLLKSTRLVRSL